MNGAAVNGAAAEAYRRKRVLPSGARSVIAKEYLLYNGQCRVCRAARLPCATDVFLAATGVYTRPLAQVEYKYENKTYVG